MSDLQHHMGSTPVPDPTVLTTEQLYRAIESVREWTDSQLDVLRERLRGIDTATELLNTTVTRVPTETTKEVTHLRELMLGSLDSTEKTFDEKFQSIATQFKERDTRSERESRDNKVAVDAAFAAQKEAAAKQDESNLKAIDKSERATAETIKTLSDSTSESLKTVTDLFRTNISALSDKIDDLKERIVASDTRTTNAVNSIDSKVSAALSALDAKTAAAVNSVDSKIGGILAGAGGGREQAGEYVAHRADQRSLYSLVLTSVFAIIAAGSLVVALLH